MENAQLTFLGTGASTGIPVIGCQCNVCTSPSAHNKRLRTCVWIQYKGKSYLIDIGPDIRQQALTHHITSVDGVIITHTHYDHIGGMEELRIFNRMQQRSIDCVINEEGFSNIQRLFFYLFEKKDSDSNDTSQINFNIVKEAKGVTVVGNLPLQYFQYKHGKISVLGLRLGNLAYLTDIKEYSDEIFDFLKGADIVIISALRFRQAKFHFTIDEAIDFVSKTQAKMSYFIHIAHEIDHEKMAVLLPQKVRLAYDGLQIPFKV